MIVIKRLRFAGRYFFVPHCFACSIFVGIIFSLKEIRNSASVCGRFISFVGKKSGFVVKCYQSFAKCSLNF